MKPASMSPRARACSCTSPVASISSNSTWGWSARKASTHCGSSPKPTVDTNASRSRPTSPWAAARACAGSAWARASNSRACGSQRPAGGGELHAALGALEQPHAQLLLQVGDGLRQRRLRHVQARGGAAEVQLVGDGDELAPQAQLDQGLIHTPSISIRREGRIGKNHRGGAYSWPSPFFRPAERAAMATQPIVMNPRSKTIVEGKSRAPNRSMYYAMGYQESDFKKPMVGVANGHSTITPCNSGPAEAGRRGHRGHRGGRRQRPGLRHADHLRRHGHGHRRHEVLAGEPRGDLRLHRDLRAGPVDGRRGRHRRLRQEHARRPDGHAARQRAGHLRLRRHHPAGPATRART